MVRVQGVSDYRWARGKGVLRGGQELVLVRCKCNIEFKWDPTQDERETRD